MSAAGGGEREFEGVAPRDGVSVAGALAELGVGRLRVSGPDGVTRAVVARETDLPGLLRTAIDGTVVEAEGADVRLMIEAGRVRWRTGDAGIAGRIGECVERG